MSNCVQGLLLRAVTDHVQARSDPILIRNFPDPNNPNILHPQILNLFQSCWNGYNYGPPSQADLTLEFMNNIQSRVKDQFLTKYTVRNGLCCNLKNRTQKGNSYKISHLYSEFEINNLGF